jgi:hypothetical protein
LEVETKTPEEIMNQEEAVKSEDELTSLKSKIGELEKEAAGKELRINGLEAKLADIAGRQKETQDMLANAINSYRTLIQ